MKRRIAKKILRNDNADVVDWIPPRYSMLQVQRALEGWYREQRDPGRRYGRWDPRWPSVRREHERKGYVFPQVAARVHA